MEFKNGGGSEFSECAPSIDRWLQQCDYKNQTCTSLLMLVSFFFPCFLFYSYFLCILSALLSVCLLSSVYFIHSLTFRLCFISLSSFCVSYMHTCQLQNVLFCFLQPSSHVIAHDETCVFVCVYAHANLDSQNITNVGHIFMP